MIEKKCAHKMFDKILRKEERMPGGFRAHFAPKTKCRGETTDPRNAKLSTFIGGLCFTGRRAFWKVDAQAKPR